jgi:hypothetical protein
MAFSERGSIAYGAGITTGLNFIVEAKGSYSKPH